MDLKEFRRNQRYQWAIHYTYTNIQNGNSVTFTKTFDINPTSIDVEPQLRMTMEKTMGGVVPVPWIAPSGRRSGYDMININLSGVWKTYVPKQELGITEKPTTIMQGILNDLNVPNVKMDRYWISVKEKEKTTEILNQLGAENRDIYRYKSIREGLLGLFVYINSAFVEKATESGIMASSSWELSFATTVFDNYYVEEGGSRGVRIGVVPISPMVIREKAEAPFLPTWSVRFAIINDDVEKFFDNVMGLLSGDLGGYRNKSVALKTGFVIKTNG